MTSPRSKNQRALALVTEQTVTQPQRIPGRSREKPVLRCGWAFYTLQVAFLAALYFGAAKLGLRMAFVAEQVTVVWPPTGIALAAVSKGSDQEPNPAAKAPWGCRFGICARLRFSELVLLRQ